MDEERELLDIKKRLEQQVAINLYQEQELRIARRNINQQLSDINARLIKVQARRKP